jgi:transcriptional regulator GlxA family with amidase domain
MKEIAWETGFFSESYFSRIFREKMGQSPSALRK